MNMHIDERCWRWRCGTALVGAAAGAGPRTRSRSACSRPSRGRSRCSARTAMRGAELALEEHNGMAGGKKIEIVKGSSDASPDSAVKAARKLVEQDGVQDPGRAALRRRRPGGQGLRQDPAERDLRQRHLGRAGHDAARSGAQLLPLLDRRRAVDGRPRRLRLQQQGLQDGGRPSPRTIRSPTRRCSASWPSSARPAAMCRRNPGCRSATRTSPRSSPRSPTTSTRSMWRSAAPTASTS